MDELQEEEREALDAIFDGDDTYKKIEDNKFQFKIIDEETEFNNFLLEFVWGADYPNEKPEINLDSFYNVHLTDQTKEFIKVKLDEEAENNVGMSMIYTLVEYAKENLK